MQNGGPFGSCIGVGLTSGSAVKETNYRQTPTSPAVRWLRNDKVEEFALAQTPRNNMVSDGCHGGGVCRTPGRECLFWPNTLTYGYSKNTCPTHKACEATINLEK